MTASNLANLNSTRTPEGGPYRPYVIKSCTNGTCETSRDERTPLLKYLPGHPDADKSGYVAFPNIDAKAESVAFNMTALKLKLLALAKTCDSKVLIGKGDSSFAIRYGDQSEPNVREDIFNLQDHGQVTSWSRQDFQGRGSFVNFASSGEIVSHLQRE